MGAQIWEILRQGIWASLTGGFFYDPHQNLFSNTFHLYLWLFLLCFPFTLYLTFGSNYIVWSVYAIVIAILFTIIKLINYALHRLFDNNEVIAESSSSQNDKEREEESSLPIDSQQGMELSIMYSSGDAAEAKPIECSSRASQAMLSEKSKPEESLENDINDAKSAQKRSKGRDAYGRPLTINIPKEEEIEESFEDRSKRRHSSPGQRPKKSDPQGHRDRAGTDACTRVRRSKASLNAISPNTPISPHGIEMLKMEPFPTSANSSMSIEDERISGIPPRSAPRRTGFRSRIPPFRDHPLAISYSDSDGKHPSTSYSPRSAEIYMSKDRNIFHFPDHEKKRICNIPVEEEDEECSDKNDKTNDCLESMENIRTDKRRSLRKATAEIHAPPSSI